VAPNLQENTHFSIERGKRIISPVKGVEFVSDRMPYIILRGLWCHIIVLNVHAPTQDKTDAVKAASTRTWNVFDKFPKYHMEIPLGDFSAKIVGKVFLTRQLGMKVYMKLVMIMELD
jgi:hypothetical protein